MPKRKTLSQKAYTELPVVNDPDHWSLKGSRRFLELVWQGIDLFKNKFPKMDLTGDEKQIERDITGNLEGFIQDALTGEEPFDFEFRVQHESWEMESGDTRPLQYDIAFVIKSNPRLKFPIEAKILRTDGQVSEYVADVEYAFLTCDYAPFSYEGGMLGYLLSGVSEKAFQNIGKSLKTELFQHPDFENRQHKFSEHSRKVPEEKKEIYPSQFRCHHLIFEFSY